VRHHLRVSRRAARKRAEEMLAWSRIPDDGAAGCDDYPHQLLRGDAPAVMIAIALCCAPSC